MKRDSFLRVLPLFAALWMLGGCAFTVDRIDLRYEPQQGVSPVESARNVQVEVSVRDVRTQTDRVAAKGVASQAAPIVSNQDVATLVRKAIESELGQRGYTVAPGKVLVACDLSNFAATWQLGFWAGQAHGSCQLSVKVKDKDGELVFSEIVTGEATEDGIQVTSGDNAKIVLEGALQDAMKKLFQMPDFPAALAKAARRSSPGVTTP